MFVLLGAKVRHYDQISKRTYGQLTFYGCTGLTSVINYSLLTFNKGLEDNGYVAYYAEKVINTNNCKQFKNFLFNATTLVHYFGDDIEVVLPINYNGENYKIGDYAFYNCTGVTSITIPNSVTSIGNSAFKGCTGLTSIEIPNSITSIEEYAFNGCI